VDNSRSGAGVDDTLLRLRVCEGARWGEWLAGVGARPNVRPVAVSGDAFVALSL